MVNEFNRCLNHYDSIIFAKGLNCYIILHCVEHHNTGKMLHSYIKQHIPNFEDVCDLLQIEEDDRENIKEMVEFYYTV